MMYIYLFQMSTLNKIRPNINAFFGSPQILVCCRCPNWVIVIDVIVFGHIRDDGRRLHRWWPIMLGIMWRRIQCGAVGFCVSLVVQHEDERVFGVGYAMGDGRFSGVHLFFNSIVNAVDDVADSIQIKMSVAQQMRLAIGQIDQKHNHHHQ